MNTLQHYFAVALFSITPPCKEITMLASKAMDTRLSLKEHLQLRTHLLICSACRRFNIQIHTLHTLAHEHFHSHNDTNESEAPKTESNKSSHIPSQRALPLEARNRIQHAITAALHDNNLYGTKR
jgi:hypothetical protein